MLLRKELEQSQHSAYVQKRTRLFESVKALSFI